MKKSQGAKNVYYSPAQDMSPTARIIGLVLRTLITYAGILGIVSFLVGAAGMSEGTHWRAVAIGPGTVALLALPVTVFCLIASLNKYCAIAAPFVYIGGYFAVGAIAGYNPIELTVDSAVRVYNMALHNVSSLGYYSIGNFMVNDGYDYANATSAVSDPLRFWGVFLLCTLIGFILYFLVQRKVRMTFLVLLMTAVIAPVLTYNIAKGNSGIGFMCVFVLGAVALKFYDHRYCGKIEKRLAIKEERAQKRMARKIAAEQRRQARRRVRAEAETVFNTAIEAGLGLKKAKAAKRAVYKARRLEKVKAKRAAKKADRANSRMENPVYAAALELKALKKQKNPKAVAEKKKEIAALRRNLKKEKAEKKKTKRREADRKARLVSFAGGYTGFGVAAVAMLAIVIPMSAVSGEFNIIEPIYNRVQIASEYVTAYLRGDDVDLNELYNYGIDELAPRELTYEPLIYESEDEIFKISSDSMNNVYLRSWVGTSFDSVEEKWTSADYEFVRQYRYDFGNEFTPDTISADYYRYVFPSTVQIDKGEVKNFFSYGFAQERVNVWRTSGQSRILFVPTRMNTDVMFLNYGLETEHDLKFSTYFDGVYSSRFFKYGTGFTTVSFVPNYSRDNAVKNLEGSAVYFERCKQFILENKDLTDKNELDYLIYEFDRALFEDGIQYMGTNLCDRYFNKFTQEEKEEFLASVDAELAYREYAEKTYGTSLGSSAAEDAAMVILTEIGTEASVGEKTMAVVEFLGNGFTYTTEPNKALYTGESTVLDSFITEIKEGYCTHFTTAACAILREMGVTVRYVEGYVASDFKAHSNRNLAGFASSVSDDDAHSWIEVYIDGMGWVAFEVTPGEKSEQMYNSSGATMEMTPEEYEELMGDKEPEKEEIDKAPAPEKDKTPMAPIVIGDQEYDPGDVLWFIRVVLITALVIAVLFVLWILLKKFIKKGNAIVGQRLDKINLARNEEKFNSPDFDRHATMTFANDCLLQALEVIGASPLPGELCEDYAQRLREQYSRYSNIDIGTVVLLMQKEEFGNGLSYEEASLCAEYLTDLVTEAYREMKPWDKLRYRFIFRKI